MKRLDLILALQLVEIVNNGSKYFFRRKKNVQNSLLYSDI